MEMRLKLLPAKKAYLKNIWMAYVIFLKGETFITLSSCILFLILIELSIKHNELVFLAEIIECKYSILLAQYSINIFTFVY